MIAAHLDYFSVSRLLIAGSVYKEEPSAPILRFRGGAPAGCPSMAWRLRRPRELGRLSHDDNAHGPSSTPKGASVARPPDAWAHAVIEYYFMSCLDVDGRADAARSTLLGDS